MAKVRLICLLTAALFLVGCAARSPSSVTVIPYVTEAPPSELDGFVTVNAHTLMIHTDNSCRHIKNTKTENIRFIAKERTDELAEMGYSFCSTCSAKAKNSAKASS